MSGCCDPISYRRLFNSKEAARRLRRYRKSGLDRLANGIVEHLAGRDIDGASLLEVGGGVGGIEIEMLRRGVGTAVNIELSDAYEQAASNLLDEAGFTDRVERRIGDFVEESDGIDPADIVLLNRVVCCYPWMERMMDSAVEKTDRFLALTFPRERWFMKASIALGNWWWSLRSCGFRAYVHPTAGIESIATEGGLEVTHRDKTLGWQAVVFERVA